MSTIRVRWAPNTASDLEEDGRVFHDAYVVPIDPNRLRVFSSSKELLADFGRHDVAVLLVDDEDDEIAGRR